MQTSSPNTRATSQLGGRPPVLLDGKFLKGQDGPNSSGHVEDGQKI